MTDPAPDSDPSSGTFQETIFRACRQQLGNGYSVQKGELIRGSHPAVQLNPQLFLAWPCTDKELDEYDAFQTWITDHPESQVPYPGP